jgi:hypothetical protein
MIRIFIPVNIFKGEEFLNTIVWKQLSLEVKKVRLG